MRCDCGGVYLIIYMYIFVLCVCVCVYIYIYVRCSKGARRAQKGGRVRWGTGAPVVLGLIEHARRRGDAHHADRLAAARRRERAWRDAGRGKRALRGGLNRQTHKRPTDEPTHRHIKQTTHAHEPPGRCPRCPPPHHRRSPSQRGRRPHRPHFVYIYIYIYIYIFFFFK